MQRYFKEIVGQEVVISGDDFHHIKNVMRMKEGHKVSICDNQICYICSLSSYQDKSVTFTIDSEIKESNELKYEIELAVGLLKGDKFDLVIQKAVELGASKIIPVNMQRSIVKLDSKKEQKKLMRWNKIAKEAAEQSKRNVIPVVERVHTVNELTNRKANLKMYAYELTDNSINMVSHLQKCDENDIILIVVGPEGGIDSKEVDKLNQAGFFEVSLGKRILRAETAAIHFVSVISAYLEYMGC
jgi:16S rRNA (uracil1498-N3)-methyltransferase